MKPLALNGTDCLMLAFDYQMRKLGFAGNLAQVVLGIPDPISERQLRKRLETIADQYAIMTAKQKRSLIKRIPFWDISSSAGRKHPHILFHPCRQGAAWEDSHALKRKILNSPLQNKNGEWLRLDLIELPSGGMEVVLTWSHALMDAHGAEYLLYMLGNGESNLPPAPIGWAREGRPSKMEQRIAAVNFFEKCRQARRAFSWIDDMATRGPVSLFTVNRKRIANRLDFRVLSFTASESDQIRQGIKASCGPLQESAYYMASVLLAFQGLFREIGIDEKSSVVSFPVNLRKIGTRFPVFTNQAGTLLYEFQPHDLENFPSAVNAFKSQTQKAVVQDALFANLCLMDLSRVLPSWYYIKKTKQSMKGEIASLVFANPGRAFSGLSRFMEREVSYLHHVPTVVAPPGVGVIFSSFEGRLSMTLVWVEGVLDGKRADLLTAEIRTRLLAGG